MRRRAALTIEQEQEFVGDTLGAISPSGIAERWHKSRKAVMLRIWRGDFVGYKSGNAWIISIASVIYWWGQPKED